MIPSEIVWLMISCERDPAIANITQAVTKAGHQMAWHRSWLVCQNTSKPAQVLGNSPASLSLTAAQMGAEGAHRIKIIIAIRLRWALPKYIRFTMITSIVILVLSNFLKVKSYTGKFCPGTLCALGLKTDNVKLR